LQEKILTNLFTLKVSHGTGIFKDEDSYTLEKLFLLLGLVKNGELHGNIMGQKSDPMVTG
jgi:hypothetical protein